MLGLKLVGEARPVTSSAIAKATGDRLAALPGPYIQLMTAWGPGRLCNVIEFPDPTADAGRFRYLQYRLRVDGAARRLAGAWAALSDAELQHGVVLGVDRRGLAIFARSASALVALHPAGFVLELGSFEELVGKFLLGGQLVLTQHAYFEKHVRAEWKWAVKYSRLHEDNDLGVPAIYATEALTRDELIEAWTAGDEARSDAALHRVLQADVTGYALIDLLHFLASPAAASIPGEIRATYADQLFRMARRRMPDLVPELPIREIRIALGKGELAPEQLARVAAMIDPPGGIFLGDSDTTEVALLEQLASTPNDEAARLVYADHLEEQGSMERAEALRGDVSFCVAPLADADQRGFVAPPDLEPIDGGERIRAHIVRWHAEDPAFSIDPAIARIDALHPTARQGYEILFEIWTRHHFTYSTHRASARQHLLREVRDAWPQLAIALRSGHRSSALALLVEGDVREMAPFILSLIRRPGPEATESWQVELADVYVQFARITKDLFAELVPYFAADATVQPIHQPHGSVPVLRATAFRFLRDFGTDDRVFEGALRYFCEAHPFSERILRKRKTDPRIRKVLGEQLAAEEKTSLKDGGRKLVYSPELGLLARYLAKLGDARAKEISERYKKFKRFSVDYQERDRDE